MAKKEQKKISGKLNELRQNNALLLVALGMMAVLIIFSIILFASESTRRVVYRDSSGAAGLTATIDYGCPNPCEDKYNFSVYFYAADGRQVSVVRPNSDGVVNMALSEGDYIMMIGKRFGDKDIFPQEPIGLKNGKTLEMKLRY